VLEKYLDGYKLYDPEYHFVFNSYYESLAQGSSARQGQSEPALRREVYRYRKYVDDHMMSCSRRTGRRMPADH